MTLPDTTPETAGVDTSQGIRVNFTDTEASSESRALLPAGKYRVRITGVETRYSKSEKNNGKPYFNLEFTVQDGPYEGRKVWTNAMLFEGALYTISQLLKALGQNVSQGQMVIPGPDFYEGKELDIKVRVKPADGQYDESNDVSGFFAIKEGSAAPAGAGSSLLP